jgi:DNA repair protein RAD50
VRSFEPKKKETIEFGKPLTLIVGANGVGKTTVIECLKYATTGAMPPNSKNGAFIHDPNILGDKQVSAEVKMAFTSINGQSMVVSRAMSLTKGPTTSKFSTTEGQLLLMNRGERTTLSTKCAELDSQVPRFLGVPKAILEYVIFCHQEDSLWPMSEPSVLKKKFDEIFQALQFTKAVSALKDIQKEMSVEVKLLEQSVKHLKIDKDRAEKTKQKLLANQRLIEDYLEGTKSLEVQLKLVTEESDELFKSNQEFQHILSNVESLKHEERSVNEQITRLQDSSRILGDSDDELQYKFTNFQVFLDRSNENVDKLKNEITSKQRDLAKLRDDINVLIREEASLKALESEYEQNIKERDLLRDQMIQELNISATDDYNQFESIFFNYLQEEQKKFQFLKDDLKNEEKKLDQELRHISENKLKEVQRKEYTAKDLNSLQQEIKKAQQQIKSFISNEGDIEYEKSSLEDLQSKFDSIVSNNYIETYSNEIKLQNGKINTIELEIEELNNDISQIHKQSDSYAKISLLNDEVKFRQQAISKLNESNSESFKTHGLDAENMYVSLKSKISKLEAEYKTAQKNQQLINDKVHEIESSIRHSQTSLDQYQKELVKSKEKFQTQLEDEDPAEYDEILSSADDDYKTALENLKMSSTTLQFNQKALQIAKNDECCYLCSRKFDDGSILSVFIKELEKKTNGDLEKELRVQANEAREYLNTVRSLSNDVEIIKTSEKKVQALSDELKTLQVHLKESQNELQESSKLVSGLDNDIESLRDLINPVSEIERLTADLNQIKNQISEKERELKNYGFSSKNLDELQVLQSDKSTELRGIRKSISKLIEDKESKQRELSILENNIKDKKLKISNLEMATMEKESLLKAIEEHKRKSSNLEIELRQADSAISALETDIEKMSEDYDNLIETNALKVNDLNKRLNSINQSYDDFKQKNYKIKEFLEKHKERLLSVTEKIQSLNGMIKNTENEIQSSLDIVSIEEKKLAGTNEEYRNLRNNIDIRKLSVRLDGLHNEIESIDIAGAEASRVEYQQKSEYLRERYSTLNAELAGKMGEIKQIEDQIRQTEKELNVEFKDVEENYRQELTKFKFKSLAFNDAGTYAKAIDTAIINFHSLKMKETNKIVEDLWKGTYSGTDIDTIKIRSDPASSSAKNRSYNYRVVMVKNDVELDMRGRCSAGQKVLASIIIRLALAECFGTNCGVIALDEPTTNLDVENIESLAKSLSNIIELRQSQKNFQLIVITHDEKFLNAMGAVKYTDHFYRIKRNQSQKSEIEWVGINRVAE